MSIDSTSETAIFERIVLPSDSLLAQEAARSLLEIGFSAADRARMKLLLAKAKAGTLSADEQDAIDNYERVGHYLSILHSKARQALRKATDPTG
ncbi:MAG: hypothetical protein K2Y37_27435 [Pirellulales bacterium]|nr:hypothetical protein [Pirellulales bacterium]